MNRKLVIGGVLVLVLVGAGGAAWRATHRDEGAFTLYGNVDVRQVDLGFRVGGRIAALNVDEGAHVPPGAELGRLDARPLQDAADAQGAQLALARANLAKYRAGARPQEIEQARQALAAQQARFAQAEAEYHRQQGLAPTGAVSQRQLEAARSDMNAARALLDQARAAYDLQTAGFRREDVAVSAAQADAAAANASKAKTDLADTVLRAPEGGTVLTRAREPGAIVQPGETVFTLTIDRPLRVRAYVAEPDLGRIAPGQAVEVSADGIARTYHGTIAAIASAAEFTPKTVQTQSLRADLVYRVRVLVSDPDGALHQGQPVSVRVTGAAPGR
ncbi:MAG TPA: HlyD family efflux transporter periplasmic adaptor subunit [Novosphingobium sp.]|nr:HlyD family efflux transporter periplasmic adaptor subunit [Novosphingobium sp.]